MDEFMFYYARVPGSLYPGPEALSSESKLSVLGRAEAVAGLK